MHTENICHLRGVVQPDAQGEACWTRWTPRQRGQVRFWLAVPRMLAGDGQDLLLCAIEPLSADELQRYQDEIRAGRSVELTACARAMAGNARLSEDHAGVIFVAESCAFGGAPMADVHRRRAVGKMAAAGDGQAALLPIGGDA
jgi:hypothetical protein